MGLMMICCGMAVKRLGMTGVGVMKMKALTVKMETVTHFVYEVYEIDMNRIIGVLY
jgi:hypothetical protein